MHQDLAGQIGRVHDALADKAWHTIRHLAKTSGVPEASVSALLRNLRKDRFGGHLMERHHRGNGAYEYRLIGLGAEPGPVTISGAEFVDRAPGLAAWLVEVSGMPPSE